MWNRLEIAETWDGQPIAQAERVQIAYQQTDTGDLEIEIDAPLHGDLAPTADPGPFWGLWEFEVVELFLVGPGGRYLEAEFGPHGHHLVLQLSGPRQIVARELPAQYGVETHGARWRGHARIEAVHVPSPIERINAFAIHGVDESRRYLAYSALPGPAPDFHQPHRFPSV